MYHRSILYLMLLRFFKVVSAVIEMIMIEFSIPDYNETMIKNIFKHWTSWSYVPYAMVHWSVLQWTRGEKVPLSLYERTFVAVLHFHFMTAFYRRPKRRRLFPFPNNYRRPSKVFSVSSQRFSLLVFLLPLYGLAFPHFFTALKVTKAAVFNVRVG